MGSFADREIYKHKQREGPAIVGSTICDLSSILLKKEEIIINLVS